MKIYIAFLLILLAWLQYRLWLGPDALVQQRELAASVAAQRAENARLAQRNAALARETAGLEHSRTAVEARARVELGMIGPGEIFYQIVE